MLKVKMKCTSYMLFQNKAKQFKYEKTHWELGLAKKLQVTVQAQCYTGLRRPGNKKIDIAILT